LLAVALSALGLALPSLAGTQAAPDVTVGYSDINIETVDGATVLLNRIKAAASDVCAPLNHGDLASRANSQRCHQKLTAAAVQKVNHPMLASVYKSAYATAPTVAAVAK